MFIVIRVQEMGGGVDPGKAGVIQEMRVVQKEGVGWG